MAEPTTPRINIDVEGYRKLAGVSVYELSKQTGIARSSLRTRLVNPGQFTLDQIEACARVLNIPATAIEVAA